MSIKNITRKTVLADGVKEAKTSVEKSLGLLLYKKSRAMIFRTRFGIHTFGMRYPIDVVILDQKHVVVSLKEDLKPWRVFVWNFQYDTVVELPEGTITKTKTKIGDVCVII